MFILCFFDAFFVFFAKKFTVIPVIISTQLADML